MAVALPPETAARLGEIREEAYFKVLRAFTSEAFVWTREKVLTDLRKELHISNEAHQEFMDAVLKNTVPPRIASRVKSKPSEPRVSESSCETASPSPTPGHGGIAHHQSAVLHPHQGHLGLTVAQRKAKQQQQQLGQGLQVYPGQPAPGFPPQWQQPYPQPQHMSSPSLHHHVSGGVQQVSAEMPALPNSAPVGHRAGGSKYPPSHPKHRASGGIAAAGAGPSGFSPGLKRDKSASAGLTPPGSSGFKRPSPGAVKRQTSGGYGEAMSAAPEAKRQAPASAEPLPKKKRQGEAASLQQLAMLTATSPRGAFPAQRMTAPGLSPAMPAYPAPPHTMSSAIQPQPQRGLPGVSAAAVHPVTGAPLRLDELIGRMVKRWWPDYNAWFDGVITDYDALKQQHCVVYDIGTDEESFEWYDVRNSRRSECKLLDGKVDVLAAPIPGSAAAATAQNGAKPHAAVAGHYTGMAPGGWSGQQGGLAAPQQAVSQAKGMSPGGQQAGPGRPKKKLKKASGAPLQRQMQPPPLLNGHRLPQGHPQAHPGLHPHAPGSAHPVGLVHPHFQNHAMAPTSHPHQMPVAQQHLAAPHQMHMANGLAPGMQRAGAHQNGGGGRGFGGGGRGFGGAGGRPHVLQPDPQMVYNNNSIFDDLGLPNSLGGGPPEAPGFKIMSSEDSGGSEQAFSDEYSGM